MTATECVVLIQNQNDKLRCESVVFIQNQNDKVGGASGAEGSTTATAILVQRPARVGGRT